MALPRPIAGMRHGDRAVDDLPSVDPLEQRFPHGVLDCLEECERHRPELDLQPEFPAGVDRSRLDAQPDSSEKRIGSFADHLDCGTGADRPFNADCCCLAERDVNAEFVRQRCLDNLLLHLTVERDGDFLANIVLPQVDQRVLLGELGERDVQRTSVSGAAGNDDGFQRRRGE